MKKQRKPLSQNGALVGVLASLLSIVVGLILGFVLLVILKPDAALAGMDSMLTRGISSLNSFSQVLYQAAPLMMCGLSVGFAFKTGLFNIGAPGQYTLGVFFALLFAIQFQMPWYVCLLASMAGGAVWGVFPGLFKALFNVNEVITSIMFNWIGMYLVNLVFANMPIMLASAWGASNSDRTAALSAANPGAIIPTGGLEKLFSDSPWINISILIAILVAIVVWVVLQKTTFGYELKACGLNKDASQYAGINAKRNVVLSMVIAGALSGLGAAGKLQPHRHHLQLAVCQLPAGGRLGHAAQLLAGDHRHRHCSHHLSGGLRTADARRHYQGAQPPQREGGGREMIVLANIISLTVVFAVPLLLVALGGMFSEHSGVINIALEGMMIIGALFACFTLQAFDQNGFGAAHPQLAMFIAILVAGLCGMIFSLLLAFAAINLKADQTIGGTALNQFAPAFAVVLTWAIQGQGLTTISIPRWVRITRETFGLAPVDGPSFWNNLNFKYFYLCCSPAFWAASAAWPTRWRPAAASTPTSAATASWRWRS